MTQPRPDLSHVEKDVVVLYHGNCLDGFTAAWLFWRQYGDRAHYEPVFYGPETRPPIGLKGKRVFVVDFGFDEVEDFLDLAAENDLVWLDHHATQQGSVSHLQHAGAEVLFDVDRSGASLAWDYLRGDHLRDHSIHARWLVMYVEDRDLWRWCLRDSRDVSAYLQTLPMRFDEWERASKMDHVEVAKLGRAVRAAIEQYSNQAWETGHLTDFAGYRCFAVNAQYKFLSEALNHVLDREPDAEIALGWYVDGNLRQGGCVHYSLRSRRGGPHVGEIAGRFGGGGHPNAAGFEVRRILPEVA